MSKILDANKVLNHKRVEFNRALVEVEWRPLTSTGDPLDLAEVTQSRRRKFKKDLETAVANSRGRNAGTGPVPRQRMIPPSSIHQALDDAEDDYG